MKALQANIVNGVHEFALKNVPKPSVEKPHYILVKVIAAAVNQSDVMNSKGSTLQGPLPSLQWVRLAKSQLRTYRWLPSYHIPADHWTRFRRSSS